MPLQFCGLGIPNLGWFGDALRSKWLFARWGAKERPLKCFPETYDKKAGNLFMVACEIKLGNGRLARFWTDNWVPGGRSIAYMASALLSFMRRKDKMVEQALANDAWIRDIRGGISVRATAEYLWVWDVVHSIQLTPGMADYIIWKRTPHGQFTVCSAYQLFFMHNIRFPCFRAIWKCKAPPRCKFFMWLVVLRKCLMADNLQRRRWPCDPICSLCRSAQEDCTHLFYGCRFSQEVWGSNADFQIPGNGTTEECWLSVRKGVVKHMRKNFDRVVLLIHWRIWKERNA